MTERRRTASVVSTFVQPSDAPLRAINQRSQQVQGVFKQLGVDMREERRAKNQELAKKTRAESNNKARILAAEYMPQIREQMERPETYQMSPEEFMKSETFQLGVKKIKEGIDAPEHQKEFLEQYQGMLLNAFTEGKVKQEYKDREREASLAQEAAANTVGIRGQMEAYDDAIASGVERNDAFTAGLATAILKGPAYVKKFAKARNWTPEEDTKIAKHLKSLKSEFNMKAAVALKLANAEQDRTKRKQMLLGVANQFPDSLSNSQKATVIADLQILDQELQTEGWVRQNIGRIPVDDMAAGIGYEGRTIPIADIKRIQDEEFYTALQSGNIERMTQIMALPGNEPDASKQFFAGVIGSLTHADGENTEAVQGALTHAAFLERTLNPARMQSVLGAEDYAQYQEFKTDVELNGIDTAIKQNKLVQELRAKGRMPTPEKWVKTQRSVVEHAMSTMKPSWYDVFSPGADSMNRAAVESQLAPYFRQWKALNLTADQMNARVDKMFKDSSWNGYLNGGVLGDTLKSMTIGNSGNPYQGKTELDLWDAYKDAKLEELKEQNDKYEGLEFIIGTNPEEVFIVDKSGLIVPNSVTNVTEIKDFIKKNVKTTKQEVKDGSEYSPSYSLEDVHP